MKILKIRKIEGYTHIKLCLFCTTIFTSSHSKKSGWFRVFGYGLAWKHKSKGLMFSERLGYPKYFRICDRYYKWLPR